MCRVIYIPGNANYRGVEIAWTSSTEQLDIGEWYNLARIPSESMTLAEFFQKLGITEKDVRKAFKKNI